MPSFNAKKWHTCKQQDWQCTQAQNCYAYALDNPAYYWAVPGFGFAHCETGKYFDAFEKKFSGTSFEQFRMQIITGAIQDGLVPTKTKKPKKGYRLVALAFPKKHHDFHWYRQDNDGMWSHKNGYQAPTQNDENNEPITDPQIADRGRYEIFAGYFLVPEKGIVLQEIFMKNTEKRQ